MEPALRFAIQGIVDGLRKAGVLTEEHLAVIVQSLADAGTEAGRQNYASAETQCQEGAKTLALAWGVDGPTIHPSRPNRGW